MRCDEIKIKGIPGEWAGVLDPFSAAKFLLDAHLNAGGNIEVFMVNDNSEIVINNFGQLLKES